MHPPLVLQPHEKDLGGGFVVRRLLPAAQCRAVGPFVFFDHMGPVAEHPEDAHDVRPHPHIGLATLTYLFEGAIMHRDSLGTAQEITPGAVNWMTAGRGIVHSERKPERLRAQNYLNHGLQMWCALPRTHEECEPDFSHTPADRIPQVDAQGVPVRVLVGQAFGADSPVPTPSETLCLDIALPAGVDFDLPRCAPEMAVYAVDGALTLDGQPLAPQHLAVLSGDASVQLRADEPRRVVVIGGAPLDGPRFLVWNFVSSRRERIVEAAQDWQAQRMTPIPGDAQEFIPLPDLPAWRVPPA